MVFGVCDDCVEDKGVTEEPLRVKVFPCPELGSGNGYGD